MLNQKLIDQEYGFLGDNIFLNVSQVVIPPLRVQKAYGSFMDNYVRLLGDGIVPKAWEIVADCRKKVASLIHAESPDEIGFVKNTCEGVSILADGLDMKPGENVVIADQEHQSVMFPWINAHQRKGINLHVVKSIRDGEVDVDEMLKAIDDKTRVLIVSSVQFSTGFRADLQKLGEVCKQRGVIFAVDGIQALGRLKIDVLEMHIDYLVAGTNKGLLGTLGAGFVYCKQSLVSHIVPPYAGYQSTVSHVEPPSITTNFETIEWYPTARRFESGNLSYNCIYAIDQGVSLLLELGIDNIEKQVRFLEEYLRAKLADLKLHVVQAKNPENWGGVICIYFPKHTEKVSAAILQKYKIHGTIRAGYIRLGLDFYNTQAQMDIVSTALHEIEQLN